MTADREWADAARDMPQMSRHDLALEAGFDPHPDDLLPPPAHHNLAADDEWMVALRASTVQAEHLTDGCRGCGERCDRCDERMCSEFGPEPRACGTTCADCPCDCTACWDARIDLRAELERQLQKDAN